MPGMFNNLMQSPLMQGVQNNYEPLLYSGMGMLSGQTPQAGFENALKGLVIGKEHSQSRKKRQALQKFMEQGGGGIQGTTPEMQAYIAANPELADQLIENQLDPNQMMARQRKGSMGQPIWAKDPKTGKMTPFQVFDDGSLEAMQFPNGLEPQIPAGPTLDLGTTQQTQNKFGQPGPAYPIDITGREAQEKLGGEAGTAQANLPAVESSAQAIKANIAAVRNHPDRVRGTGGSSYFSGIRGPLGTTGFNSRVAQITGQSFLQAFETLKGGGQISNSEGLAATAASNRLQDSIGDEAEFLAALNDLEREVERLVEVARKKAALGLTKDQELKDYEGRAAPAGDGWREIEPGVRIRKKQ